ncbi:MAG: ethanolamine ammonia-lyase reactivating factor EutA [Minicystis sp.]
MKVTLAGIDIGTTTTRLSVAEARVARRAGEGRVAIGEIEERLAGGPVRTPFVGAALDVGRLLAIVVGWLADAGAPELFGGGALITGLAARASNAGEVIAGLRARLGDAVIALADDPRLEAWLAFQGSVGAHARAHPDETIVNLDIGGGTTNVAVGRGGAVLGTGCLWIGARHVEVEPGSYRVTRCSPEGEALLASLGITKGPGDVLAADEVGAFVDALVRLLEAAAEGRAAPFASGIGRRLVDAPIAWPEMVAAPTISLSGGVGELVHAIREGRPLPATTCFGDLGIDLARRIAASPVLGSRCLAPASAGRATVIGLLRHATRVSGATVFLGAPERLPLRDLPIVGAISADPTAEQARPIVALAEASRSGACIVITGAIRGHAALRALGEALAAALAGFPPDRPLVLLVAEDVGKALGGYVTAWGRAPRALYVLDEMAPDDAHFVHVGRPSGGVVPIAFHGIR